MFVFGYFSLIVCLFIRKNMKSEPARCFPSLLFLLVVYKLFWNSWGMNAITETQHQTRCTVFPILNCSPWEHRATAKLVSVTDLHRAPTPWSKNVFLTLVLRPTPNQWASPGVCRAVTVSNKERHWGRTVPCLRNSPLCTRKSWGWGLPASAPGSAVWLHSPGL